MVLVPTSNSRFGLCQLLQRPSLCTSSAVIWIARGEHVEVGAGQPQGQSCRA